MQWQQSEWEQEWAEKENSKKPKKVDDEDAHMTDIERVAGGRNGVWDVPVEVDVPTCKLARGKALPKAMPKAVC